jgi:transcriptional regulator with XRE-family HTH domain
MRNYGFTHMGMHIGFSYGPATFDCMDKVGLRIRAMRKALGLSQVELAGKLGVNQSTLSDMENGAGFSAELLIRLAEILGGSPTLIMRGADERTWPFPTIPVETFLALEPQQRGYVEGRLAAAIEEVTAPPTPDEVRRFSTMRTSPPQTRVARKRSA